MEPTQSKMKILLGEFEVVDVYPDHAMTIDLGRKVYITIHVGNLPHYVKRGDKLPLFTEISYAHAGQTSVQ